MGAIAALRDASPRALGRMLDVVPHRAARRQTVTVGGVSLSAFIGDRDEASVATAEGLAVAVSGVVDNLGEIAPGALGTGHAAQVVLAACKRNDLSDVCARMRGSWAVIVTDGTTVWCARDHLGLEMLFFRAASGELCIATEAKQVVTGANIPYEPDLGVVEAIVFSDYDDDLPSALNGVERVPKTTVLTFSEGGNPHRSRYWEPERLLETARYGNDELRERFAAVMTQAATRVLTGNDVLLLSGGIDAPAVAAFGAPEHQRLFGRSLPALSWVFPDYPSCDESDLIELVADRYDMPLHTYQPQPPRLDALESSAQLFDGPWPVWSPQWATETYQRVKALGHSTVLSGMFAEFVTAMDRFTVTHLLAKGRLSALRRYVASQRADGMPARTIARQLVGASVPRRAMVEYQRRFRSAFVPSWVDGRRIRDRNLKTIQGVRRRWPWQQTTGFRGPGLSWEASAICQEACGVRERMPWADIDVWEFFLSLPAETKFPDVRVKPLARDLLRGRVPDEILDRHQKVVMNEFMAAGMDYPVLRKYLTNADHRLHGIDYQELGDRIDREQLMLNDYMWAKDLAAAHAFLSLW